MSAKIYDGYVLHVSSFEQINGVLIEVASKLKLEAARLLAARMLGTAIRHGVAR